MNWLNTRFNSFCFPFPVVCLFLQQVQSSLKKEPCKMWGTLCIDLLNHIPLFVVRLLDKHPSVNCCSPGRALLCSMIPSDDKSMWCSHVVCILPEAAVFSWTWWLYTWHGSVLVSTVEKWSIGTFSVDFYKVGVNLARVSMKSIFDAKHCFSHILPRYNQGYFTWTLPWHFLCTYMNMSELTWS